MKKYFEQFSKGKSSGIVDFPDVLEACWRSPSNIALVKYWGKKQGQLPANPSLSMTLSKAVTYTGVRAYPASPASISINDDIHHPFIPKLQKLYHLLSEELTVLRDLSLEVRTENSFPHSTGIASSASGISAFTLCLLNIAATLSGSSTDSSAFFRAASYASRLGSGSACRSLYGGFTLWGKTGIVSGTSDLEAVPVNEIVHPDFLHLRDTILIVSSEPKSLASSWGHNLMDTHPFARSRYIQANKNLVMILRALNEGDFDLLAAISENEALSLHALMMTSTDQGFLIRPGTVEIIQKIRNARKNGLPVFFTLDAGPNVHMLYPKRYSAEVEWFTNDELIMHCENQKTIVDYCGEGPVPIHTSLF